MPEYRSPFEIKRGERPRVDLREFTLRPRLYLRRRAQTPARAVAGEVLYRTVYVTLLSTFMLVALALAVAVSVILIGSLGLLFWAVLVMYLVGEILSS